MPLNQQALFLEVVLLHLEIHSLEQLQQVINPKFLAAMQNHLLHCLLQLLEEVFLVAANQQVDHFSVVDQISLAPQKHSINQLAPFLVNKITCLPSLRAKNLRLNQTTAKEKMKMQTTLKQMSLHPSFLVKT
jgi:hypothetical protein